MPSLLLLAIIGVGALAAFYLSRYDFRQKGRWPDDD